MGLHTEEKYFNWLCNLVYDSNSQISYSKLLRYLHETNYTWVMPKDENRAFDGIALRDRFLDTYPYINSTIEGPCTNLEMLIALSVRCEESIMSDDIYGDRTGEWFWNMLLSLGLIGMDDRRFNYYEVDEILFIFHSRLYRKDGKGGLFTISDPNVDMRGLEIWYQMHAYLEEIES